MIYLSIAICFVAAIARDALRAWLKYRGARELQTTRVEKLELALSGQQERAGAAIGKMAVEIKLELNKLRAENEALRKHIDGQVVGTIAQLPNVGTGFNRRGG